MATGRVQTRSTTRVDKSREKMELRRHNKKKDKGINKSTEEIRSLNKG